LSVISLFLAVALSRMDFEKPFLASPGLPFAANDIRVSLTDVPIFFSVLADRDLDDFFVFVSAISVLNYTVIAPANEYNIG